MEKFIERSRLNPPPPTFVIAHGEIRLKGLPKDTYNPPTPTGWRTRVFSNNRQRAVCVRTLDLAAYLTWIWKSLKILNPLARYYP